MQEHDEEGFAALHQAIAVADPAGDRASSVAAHRELGYVNVQAACASAAERWLSAAEAMAEGDAEHAAVYAFQGMNLSDTAYDGPALERLGDRWTARRPPATGALVAGRVADRAGSTFCRATTPRQWSTRAQHRPDRGGALGRVSAPGRALRAEVQLRAGDVEGAAERLEHAFSMACQVDDPC